MRCIERKRLDYLGVTVMAVYVTGNPLLDASENLPLLRKHPIVKEIARNYNVNTVCVLIKYLIQQNIVSLVKITCVDELDKICETIDSFTLTVADMRKLQSLDQGGDARLRDFVDYKGCKNHPEFPYFYDARHPDVNPGKWKRSRNLCGTPPRYDYLDPNCPFPINEYDNRRLPYHTQGTSVLDKKIASSVTEEATRDQETHTGQSKKVAARCPDENISPHVRDRASPKATNMISLSYHRRKGEADTTLQDVWAMGSISLALMTENGSLKNIPTRFSGEFQVLLKPEDTMRVEMSDETGNEEVHVCCLGSKEAEESNHPRHTQSSSAPTAQGQIHAQVMTDQFEEEKRQGIEQQDEVLNQPDAKKCCCVCRTCGSKRLC